jgi:biotin carboxylase
MSRILLLVPTTSYRAATFVSAAQALDVDITLASEKTSSLEKFQPVDLVTLDFSDAHACAAKTVAFAREHPVHAVIGVDDQATVAASAAAAALQLPHNPLDAAYATRNKHTMRKRLDESGVPVPGFRTLSVDVDPREAAGEVTFPCVIKPLMMAASRGVIRADNTDELVTAFERVRSIVQMDDAPQDDESRTQVLVEDYVPGWEVAVEGMLTSGRLHVFAVFDKPDPLEGPYFPETIYTTPSRLPKEVRQRVCRLTQEATQVLGLRHGPVHAEIRGTADEMWFIEVAARSIGGYCSKVLRFDGGLSLEDIILRHALDPNMVLPERAEGAAGVMMVQSPRRGVFAEARGVESARDVKHVDEIIISAHPGQELSPLPEGFLYIGFIFARAGTPAAVEKALRQAYGELEFVIEETQGSEAHR